MLKEQLTQKDLILMEAGINERLRRSPDISLHPRLSNGLLIYDPAGQQKLSDIFTEYIKVAERAKCTILLTAPTWRANKERLDEAGVNLDVNGDSIRFMRRISAKSETSVYIGGLLGCKNDCYRPDEGISVVEAQNFHRWQISKLTAAGADFLMAATLPALPEAIGIAKEMSASGTPYIISFVINRESRLLDGTELQQAFEEIDTAARNPPLGFMINCAYPSFLNWKELPNRVLERLIGYQANASSMDHSQLDGAVELYTDPLSDWGDRMLEMHQKAGIQILGGCCGTDDTYLEYLTARNVL